MLLNHSKICINPPKGIELGGFGYFLKRQNEGIMDDIFARALFLKHDGLSYLIICCDLVGLHPTIVDQVKTRLSSLTNIPLQAILILYTHTHTSPACMFTIGCGEIDPKYIGILIEKLVKVGTAAVDGGKKVKGIRWVKQPVEPIGYNRAIPKGPVDNNLYAIVFELDGTRLYVLASYSCHPVTFGPSKFVSADFPGAFISTLNYRGYDGMFANGFNGDIDPVSNSIAWGSGTQEIVNNYGRILSLL